MSNITPPRAVLDATADEIADVLGVDPEKILTDGKNVVLNNAQARRLLALAKKATAKEV